MVKVVQQRYEFAQADTGDHAALRSPCQERLPQRLDESDRDRAHGQEATQAGDALQGVNVMSMKGSAHRHQMRLHRQAAGKDEAEGPVAGKSQARP